LGQAGSGAIAPQQLTGRAWERFHEWTLPDLSAAGILPVLAAVLPVGRREHPRRPAYLR
jgi:hypothetical protein